jgi:hypothetical protein
MGERQRPILSDTDPAHVKWKRTLQLPKCATCKWWLPVWLGGSGPMDELGVCHRYPPALYRGFFKAQRTKSSDFCGEHAPTDL